MKIKLFGLAILAAGLSGMASAAVINGASAFASLNLSEISLTALSSSVTASVLQFTDPTAYANALGPVASSAQYGFGNSSAGAATSSSSSEALALGNVLTAFAQTKNGSAFANEQETLTFTLTIPYALLSSSNGNNSWKQTGNSVATVGAYGNVAKNQSGSLFAEVTSQTGGVHSVADGSSLEFLLNNQGRSATTYTFDLGASAQAFYSGTPAPVPEVPASLMLSLGLLPLASRRGRKILGL